MLLDKARVNKSVNRYGKRPEKIDNPGSRCYLIINKLLLKAWKMFFFCVLADFSASSDKQIVKL